MSFQLLALDTKPDEILAWITQTKEAIVKEEMENGSDQEDLIFLTFWNFDYTILDGDTVEGRVDRDGKRIFKGMAQIMIEAGLAAKYPAKGGFAQFWKDYQAMEAVDEPKAYSYAAQIVAGAKPQEVLKIATQYFDQTLKAFFFEASLDLIHGLQQEGIHTWILTASPQIFVQGASSFLNIPLEQVDGMETVVKNGFLTDQMVMPLTTREGKIQKIKEIVQQLTNKKKKVYVLAGFGNNNANDMPFLNWIANQKLLKGKPLAVIGYKAPELQQENFRSLPLKEVLKPE